MIYFDNFYDKYLIEGISSLIIYFRFSIETLVNKFVLTYTI